MNLKNGTACKSQYQELELVQVLIAKYFSEFCQNSSLTISVSLKYPAAV